MIILMSANIICGAFNMLVPVVYLLLLTVYVKEICSLQAMLVNGSLTIMDFDKVCECSGFDTGDPKTNKGDTFIASIERSDGVESLFGVILATFCPHSGIHRKEESSKVESIELDISDTLKAKNYTVLERKTETSPIFTTILDAKPKYVNATSIDMISEISSIMETVTKPIKTFGYGSESTVKNLSNVTDTILSLEMTKENITDGELMSNSSEVIGDSKTKLSYFGVNITESEASEHVTKLVEDSNSTRKPEIKIKNVPSRDSGEHETTIKSSSYFEYKKEVKDFDLELSTSTDLATLTTEFVSAKTLLRTANDTDDGHSIEYKTEKSNSTSETPESLLTSKKINNSTTAKLQSIISRNSKTEFTRTTPMSEHGLNVTNSATDNETIFVHNETELMYPIYTFMHSKNYTKVLESSESLFPVENYTIKNNINTRTTVETTCEHNKTVDTTTEFVLTNRSAPIHIRDEDVITEDVAVRDTSDLFTDFVSKINASHDDDIYYDEDSTEVFDGSKIKTEVIKTLESSLPVINYIFANNSDRWMDGTAKDTVEYDYRTEDYTKEQSVLTDADFLIYISDEELKTDEPETWDREEVYTNKTSEVIETDDDEDYHEDVSTDLSEDSEETEVDYDTKDTYKSYDSNTTLIYKHDTKSVDERRKVVVMLLVSILLVLIVIWISKLLYKRRKGMYVLPHNSDNGEIELGNN